MMFPSLCCGVVRFPGECSNCLLSSYAAPLPLPGPEDQVKHPGRGRDFHPTSTMPGKLILKYHCIGELRFSVTVELKIEHVLEF